MLVDLGFFAFVLIGVLLSLNLGAGILAWGRQDRASARVQQTCGWLILPLFVLVLFSLIWALVQNNFDLLFVAQNTNPATPLIYKIVGVWGNHEGSLILWQLMLALFLGILSWRPAGMPRQTHVVAQGILALILAAFYGFSALLANPFAGNGLVPPGSGDLNVLLQDIGQIIHPPLLYVGYTATAASFALVVAILLTRQTDTNWASWLRPWALLSWSFLTAGIALGSFWAYYELGWGGWWFWDPVENLALLPWLLGTALIHSLQAVQARAQLVGWTLLLAILTFLMVLLGTFIVRSGLLTSVHAFAVDPDRGLYLLIVLILATGLGLFAYAWGLRARTLLQAPLAVDRQGALLLNNLLLMALFTAVLAGTLAPTAIELAGGDTYVVRERFYVPTFVYPSLLLLMLMAIGTSTRWARRGLTGAWLLMGTCLGLGALATILATLGTLPLRASLMLALGLWVLGGTLIAWRRLVPNFRALQLLPLRAHGWAVAHLGLALAVLGMAASSLMSAERIFVFDGAQSRTFFGQELQIRPRFWLAGDNYQSLATAIAVPGRGLRLAETRLYHPLAASLNPASSEEDREFLVDQGQPASEAAIFRGLWFDLFINVQDRSGGAPLMTVARKAGINWIWLGAILMTLGGLLALWPRPKLKGA